jgi:hypothetical protein
MENTVNTKYAYLLLLTIVLTLPGSVKCDMGDSIASLILFFIISIFICAGIGWWSRRQEGNK